MEIKTETKTPTSEIADEKNNSPTSLEKFLGCMEYKSGIPRPSHELGAWQQTRLRWQEEASNEVEGFKWNWFFGEDRLGLDPKKFIPVNYGFLPPFEEKVFEKNDNYEIRRNAKGIITKALITGTVNGQRICMDEYMEFPVKEPQDFEDLKFRLQPDPINRPQKNLDERIENVLRHRNCPLVLGMNTAANGFYWRAREFMGTENLSFAWYDYPKMMHEMMEFYADFIIEVSRPVLEKISIDYFCFNEDLSMKSGPLLSPETFKTFIFPHLKRVVEFFRSHGTRYIAVDSDGNPELLIPQFLDAGVDTIWPLERASNVDPRQWRKKFGKSLRLWGGVDKRILPLGEKAVKNHLKEFIPLIEEGGFIPTVDHTVPPDISWDEFRRYMDLKKYLLEGRFEKLE